jgi:hypothetical protein
MMRASDSSSACSIISAKARPSMQQGWT